MAEFDKIKLEVRKWQGDTPGEAVVQPISGEALKELLSIDENPMNAILKAVKLAIYLRNRYGSSFEVLNKQKGQRATDIFEWASI